MEKRVTLKTVQEAITTLQSQGERISQRKIRTFLGGGNPNEINRLLKQIEAADSDGIELPAELPPTLVKALLAEVTNLVIKATESLRKEVEKTQSRESEALEDLTKSEQKVETLEKQLKEVIDEANRGRQEAEKTAAISAREIADLKNRVGPLEAERKHLIEAGERARMEAARALTRAESDCQSLEKADARARELEVQLTKMQEEKFQAERARAVAEQRSNGLEESLLELKKEAKDTIGEQKIEIQELRATNFELQKSLALAEREIEKLKFSSGLE
ncbi:MAG: hypothetical protein R2940_13320 [Syntrophotaleaceae bacterium]